MPAPEGYVPATGVYVTEIKKPPVGRPLFGLWPGKEQIGCTLVWYGLVLDRGGSW